jgi:hypothetical protein
MTHPSEAVGATRRALLAAGALGGVSLAGGLARAAAPAVDLATPAGRLRTYMLMRGALDDRLVIGFISGRYYGVVDDEIRPLYGVVGATFGRYRARPGGGYDGASYEVPFFTDLETGLALERWRNPYTGEDVAVPRSAFPPAALVITPDLEIKVPRSPPGLVASDRVVSSFRSGPDIWMTEETTSAFTLPGAAKPVRYSELVNLHALHTDFQAPGQKRVPCQTTYTSVVSWRPWLKMGDRSGHLLGQGAGGYGVSFDQLPANWHAAAARWRPDVLGNPARALEGLLPG